MIGKLNTHFIFFLLNLETIRKDVLV